MMTDMPTVRCARCNKPVDRLVVSENVARMGRVFVVHCHGERDEMFMSDRDLADIVRERGSFPIVGAVAFRPPALEATA